MRNIITLFICFICAILATVGIIIYFVSIQKQTQSIQKQTQLEKMSLDEKIGQMLIVGFEHTYLDEHVKKMIIQYHIGGINLLGRNVQDISQTKKLTADLQKIAKIPLFIATDQEGGKSNRFNFLYELTPQIKINEIQQAEQIAFDRAMELRKIGVNMNFSPVLDYVSNNKSYLYNRTFGTDATTTGELGNAMIKGYIKGGIVPVAKHFPGYGNLFWDPHRNQVTLSENSHELKQSLIPFQKIIIENSAMVIMTAHILIPEVDINPATVSSKFISGILRKEMGFKGVIITDEMEMVSIEGAAIEQSVVNAVKAGVDMIISTYTPGKQIKIFDRLRKAVLDKEITEERINESVMRILNLKSILSS